MATILFSAYRIVEVHEMPSGKSYVIAMDIGQEPPFPRETIEAQRLADVQLAFEGYVARARATGKQLSVSAYCRAGRKPSGFDKAFRGDVYLNV